MEAPLPVTLYCVIRTTHKCKITDISYQVLQLTLKLLTSHLAQLQK